MSEYQYYEFQAIDRALTPREIAEVSRTSSRATITSRSFVNEYHWGDFRGKTGVLMERYYDAFLYLANWGTHCLSLRLPRTALDLGTAKLYAPGCSAIARAKGGHVILDLVSNSEDGGDEDDQDGAGRLNEIVPVRAELARGDHRALYLGWLFAAQVELDDDVPEPPCPPGLGELSPALEALADFLRIEPRLLEVAAERSERLPRPSPKALASAIAAWPAREKDTLLVRLARGEDATVVQGEVFGRLTKARPPRARSAHAPRTAGELREAAQVGVA